LSRNRRIVAAVLVAAGAAGGCAAALAPRAGGGAAGTLITLQVAPRGLGSVSAAPPGLDSDNHPVAECSRNYAQHACEWRYARGTRVTLTAKPDSATGRSFASWSTLDCPATRPCEVVLEDDLTSIVAVFTPLRLAVRRSNAEAGSVSTNPPGAACRGELHDPTPDLCRDFPARTRVTLTASATSPHRFKQWSSNCASVAPASCAITVLDEATWVGASFDDDRLPVLPTTIKVQFRLRKRGGGSGRVTGSELDCGSRCGAQYDYGTSLTLAAVPNRGSVFDGWKAGVCAATATRCTVPVGPITEIAARFVHPPSAPPSLRVKRRTRTSITVSWSASTSQLGIARYRVYLNGGRRAQTAKTRHKLRRLKCGRRYAIAVEAVDAHGYPSKRTRTRASTTPCAG